MFRTENKDIWRVFREHHYLSAEMNKAADCYTVYWENVLVGFVSVLPQPSGLIKYAKRVSRLVILPDYQNLGIGSKVLEFLGEYYYSKGYKLYIRSTHLRLREYLNRSCLWESTSHNGRVQDKAKGKVNLGTKDRCLNRVAYSYQYLGKERVNKPNITIHVKDCEGIDYNIFEQDLIWLKQNYYVCVVTGISNLKSNIEEICLKLGIRTQLLYKTNGETINVVKAYKNKKIITVWDKNFSDKVRNYYK